MKNLSKILLPVIALVLAGTGCKKFDEINVDPYLANESQVQVEYFINGAIITDQMDPNISERTFVLYWKTAARQQWGGGISTGGYNDDWSSQWYGSNYQGKALNRIYSAIDVANKQIASGKIKEYTNNLLQIARIYRVYLLSELTDNFGPIPLNGFQGVNPDFSDVKTVYYFMLDELKDATSKLDVSIVAKPSGSLDPAYGYDYTKWKKYGNSMRLRLAMRLSEVDASKAKAEFEDAASKDLITSPGDAFQVQEKDGWDDLTGVMSRQWNYYQLSQTLNNLYTGLGGIKSADQGLSSEQNAAIKAANYAGMRFLNHWPTKTNDPMAGFWLDGLPYSIDPRAYVTFIIPGDVSNPQYNKYPSWDNSAVTTVRTLTDANGNTIKTLDAKNTYNGIVDGSWGEAGAKNNVARYNGATPRLAQHFRNSTDKRMFFGAWETYFLLAEGAVRGWSTPMSGKEAYEAGIDASLAYAGVSQYAAAYKASTEYNRVGTSVSWDHTTEPAATHTMNYIDGYTGTPGTVEIKYPVNGLYKNGTVKNDHLTKIITQKFIAQNPWVPIEAWNDQRRLGLPFFENPAVETPLTNMPDLNSGNYMTSSVKFFPQRLKYPSSVPANNAQGYEQALSQLGGPDNVLTPLWWAQH